MCSKIISEMYLKYVLGSQVCGMWLSLYYELTYAFVICKVVTWKAEHTSFVPRCAETFRHISHSILPLALSNKVYCYINELLKMDKMTFFYLLTDLKSFSRILIRPKLTLNLLARQNKVTFSGSLLCPALTSFIFDWTFWCIWCPYFDHFEMILSPFYVHF